MKKSNSVEWFEHDRFGMFVHWGLYSVPAGVWQGNKAKHGYAEWLQGGNQIPREDYQRLTEVFNPTKFDAEAWIGEAKRAGMRYFLITAKHHDGFALWPSKASKYNVIDATPFKRDILGELAYACRKFDIKLGFYYSHWQDWEGTGGDICSVHMENDEYQHPSDEVFSHYWKNKCLVQVQELLEYYSPAFFWFDTWSEDSYKLITDERQDELIDLIKNHSPDCLVNSRIQFLKPSERVDFLSMMDNSFPDEDFTKPWETSGTLNHSWSYHSMDYQWKSTDQLIRYLVANASNGGNYQLNVGPTGEGLFQVAAIRRLREIGAWMDANGESIYGTYANPLEKVPWGKITARRLDNGNTRLYLHLWEFTPGTAVQLKGVKKNIISAIVLETEQPITTESSNKSLWIELPEELSGLNLPVIALEIEGENLSKTLSN